jgi:hypothetical protein
MTHAMRLTGLEAVKDVCKKGSEVRRKKIAEKLSGTLVRQINAKVIPIIV